MSRHSDAGMEAWERLWADVAPETAHPIDPGALGEYAAVLQEQGPDAAATRFPEVAAHLATSCQSCADDLLPLAAFALAEQSRRRRRPWLAIGRSRAGDVVAALLVLLAAGLAFSVVSTQQADQQAQLVAQRIVVRTPVLVARVNIPAGVPLAPDYFELRELPAEAVLPGAARSLDQVEGKVLTMPVAAGEQILTSRLQNPSVSPVKGLASSDDASSAVLPADLTSVATAAQLIAAEISPTSAAVGDVIEIKITVKNTSDRLLPTQGPQPGYLYPQDQSYFTLQFPSETGKWRVGVGSGGQDPTDLPHRWGLGTDLAPGATVTVSGRIKLTGEFVAAEFRAALIEEPARVVSTRAVSVMASSARAVVVVDAANVRSSPSIAATVVDQVSHGTELEIVGQSADWFKVRLPDGREGWVAAGWIVRTES